MRIFGRASDLFIILLRATPHEFYTRLNDLLSKIDGTSIEWCQRLIEQCTSEFSVHKLHNVLESRKVLLLPGEAGKC